MTAEATAAERAAVDAVLGPPETSWEGGARTAVDLRVSRAPEDRRTQLLPVLHALQAAVGWISEGGLNYACERLTVPPAEAYGVATSTRCSASSEQPATVRPRMRRPRVPGRRAARELPTARKRVDRRDGEDRRAVRASACATQAPAVLVQEAGEDAVTTSPARDIDGRAAACRQAGGNEPLGRGPARGVARRADVRAAPAARRAGRPDVAAGRVPGARRLRGARASDRPRPRDRDPADHRCEAARPRRRRVPDRGEVAGGRRPTVTGPKYVICNADESEPGTFKDRVIMEQDPFAVIEALTIAGFATGAERGYLYIRGEYPRATRAPARGDRRGARRRTARPQRAPWRVRLRHRAPAWGGRLHLRRGDRAVQLDRGQAR